MKKEIDVAVAKFGFSTEMCSGGMVLVRDKKMRLAARVHTDGTIERVYEGRHAICSSLVRDAIVSALAVKRNSHDKPELLSGLK